MININTTGLVTLVSSTIPFLRTTFITSCIISPCCQLRACHLFIHEPTTTSHIRDQDTRGTLAHMTRGFTFVSTIQLLLAHQSTSRNGIQTRLPRIHTITFIDLFQRGLSTRTLDYQGWSGLTGLAWSRMTLSLTGVVTTWKSFITRGLTSVLEGVGCFFSARKAPLGFGAITFWNQGRDKFNIRACFDIVTLWC